MNRSLAAHILCTFSFAAFVTSAQAESWRGTLQPFLASNCIDCHNESDPAGALDLQRLDIDLTDLESIRVWTLVHDRLQAGEMPPPDHPAPDPKERAAALKTLASALLVADRSRSDVVLRRLNRNEYENTVRDLFGAEVSVREMLPKDTSVAGFDNIGEGLAISAEAVEAYLQAADHVLDAVFGPSKEPKRIRHETNLLDQKTHDGKQALANQFGKMFRKTEDGVVIFQSNYCPTNLVNFARLRAPAGTYRGTFRVRAIQSDRPVTLRIYAGDTIVGRREKHLVGYFDVPPDVWTTIEFEDRLREPSGTFQPKCYGTRDTRANADSYPEPGIEIGDIVIEGPLEPWPPRSREMLLGDVDLDNGTIDDARSILSRILPKAYRRETRSEEVEPFVQLVQAALDENRSFQSALRLGLKGILCSPEFLYLDEPGRSQVSDFALATRLSYFLWSSMPDDHLMQLASASNLQTPESLQREVERMLSDPRSAALVENFVGQWLNLRDIDFTSPDMNLYPDFDELLRISMMEETHRFFRSVLDHDRSLLDFVDSDYTFVNQRLAEHYGIDGVQGQQFREVRLPSDSVRGGMITQASVLKVTANGTTTSPVIRGAWVMERILGLPVPPPPSNVPAVEPDIRGATTMRQQLEKHRADPACSVCHQKIDPAGFALENFDVIGGWRDRYRTLGDGPRPEFSQDPHTFAWIRYRFGLPVDSSGRTEGGERFQDVRDFKRILMNQPSTIARGLTEKLATYALGRRIGFSDREEIDRIVGKVARKNYGFRTLVHEIVQSEMFRRP